ncbi:hypothetical protein [Streptomyces sp. MZ04]|uniref:hypothetical protein n=1 Tax=Streptomyces sp. MZ04 TaxID=2559236 RepID=UPI00107ED9C7|nr:hypothetical protein [Streptomyces sp. MZ04]TGB13291.1 hypothetical protein E2651_09760 [Streptomyces sp. MZ04]
MEDRSKDSGHEPDLSAGRAEADTWARDMVRGLPPIPYDDVLKIGVYRSTFPWMPWSLKRDPVAGDAA